MGEVNLIEHYPRSPRPIDERARLITEEHRRIVRRFGPEFFDGDRLTGYGGYRYHPRFWTETVRSGIESVRGNTAIATADALLFRDRSFHLVISTNTVHNLPLDRCRRALQEIEPVSRGHAFVTMDAWRNDGERTRMLAWNLTVLTYMHVDEWKALFADVGYTGDYYWFIAE